MKKLSLLLVTMVIAFAGCKKDKTDYMAIDHKAILAYIAANNLTATETGSGLYYVVTNPGGTAHPISTSTCYVKYRGFLLDGTQFDSSYEASDQPAQLVLSTLVPGFAEGMKLFGAGGKGKLIIPSDLGYKDVALASVPAHSVLIFDFELVSFK